MRFIWVPLVWDLGGTRESTTLLGHHGPWSRAQVRATIRKYLDSMSADYNGATFLTEAPCLKWCEHSRIIRTLSKPRCLKFSYLPEQIPKTHAIPWRVGAKSASPLSAVLPLISLVIVQSSNNASCFKASSLTRAPKNDRRAPKNAGEFS